MPRQDDDDNFETIIGHDGRPVRVLRDGRSLRVSMMMRDSLPPLQRAVMLDSFSRDAARTARNKPGFRRLNDAEATDAVAQAYESYDAELTTAWQRDAKQPDGAYPLSAGEGTPCTVDGAPGTLVREGDWLVCKPTHTDAASFTDERAQAYEAYDQQLRDAWRTPR